ncbi:MAG: hypothetical protein KC505_06955 [Myxococcales bacterium]|nr:hypothetical protein [Myxococcales bacterium]USN50498.1 MAG: hypothetical protein H6731_09585 [Myxococcales bacterium]
MTLKRLFLFFFILIQSCENEKKTYFKQEFHQTPTKKHEHNLTKNDSPPKLNRNQTTLPTPKNQTTPPTPKNQTTLPNKPVTPTSTHSDKNAQELRKLESYLNDPLIQLITASPQELENSAQKLKADVSIKKWPEIYKISWIRNIQQHEKTSAIIENIFKNSKQQGLFDYVRELKKNSNDFSKIVLETCAGNKINSTSLSLCQKALTTNIRYSGALAGFQGHIVAIGDYLFIDIPEDIRGGH